MKLHLKILVLTVIVTGGMFMASHDGRCNSKYNEYSSVDPELGLTMDYISDWQYSEHRGSYGRYAQVQFYGTIKEDIAPSFIVTVERSSKIDLEPLTINALADDLVKKRMHFDDAEVLARSETKLHDLPAVDMTLAYKQPDQLHSVEFNLIPFKERVVIFQKDDKFYTLRYVNPENVFGEFEEDFLHCIKTLSLKE